jgi:hypothetical protein
MEDPSWNVTLLKLRGYLPETQEEAERLAALIERAIDHETSRGVHDLSVTIAGGDIVLGGHCESFYQKQLAQHAAMSLSSGQHLINGIDVS